MTNTKATRTGELRANNMVKEYNMAYISPLDLPPGVAKDGYVYYWAAKDIRGEPVYEVERLASKGWTLVPADRAPQYSLDPLKRNPLADKYICWKELILMERPEIYTQQETQMFNQANDKRMRSLQGVSNDLVSFSNRTQSINSFH